VALIVSGRGGDWEIVLSKVPLDYLEAGFRGFRGY
jgi:hypothetical protein